MGTSSSWAEGNPHIHVISAFTSVALNFCSTDNNSRWRLWCLSHGFCPLRVFDFRCELRVIVEILQTGLKPKYLLNMKPWEMNRGEYQTTWFRLSLQATAALCSSWKQLISHNISQPASCLWFYHILPSFYLFCFYVVFLLFMMGSLLSKWKALSIPVLKINRVESWLVAQWLVI